MSITKGPILTKVNTRLQLSETNIDAQILTAIQEIVSLVPGINEKDDTVSISAAASRGSLPSDFAALGYGVVVTAGQLPLEQVKSLADLYMLQRASSTAGTPTSYAIHGAYLHVYRTASTDTTLTLHYEYEDTSADSITLPDVAQEAIIEGVCKQLEADRGLVGNETPQAVGHERLFDRQIAILQSRYNRRKG